MVTLSFSFVVSGIAGSVDFASRRNIKKPILSVRYRGSVTSTEASCAYVGTKEINPAGSLSIIHLEDSIPENSLSSLTTESRFSSFSWTTPSRNFVLTDVFGDYTAEIPEPFYWKCVLPDPSIDPDSVVIVAAESGEVDRQTFKALQVEAHDPLTEEILPDTYEECAVYSNYKNTYDPDTGQVSLYFVRYEVSGKLHYQLLDQQPAYTEATTDDVSSVTGVLKYWRRVYALFASGGGYDLTLPTADPRALKLLDSGRVLLREPVLTDDAAPWFLSITNGSFSALRSGETFTYSVPEYASQSFSPLYPYKVSVEESATRIRGDVLKVARQNLQVDSSLYAMRIVVKDRSDATLFALTTKLSDGGTLYKEGETVVTRVIGSTEEAITWDTETIVGWDRESGFIHLGRDFPDTYSFLVSYYYRAEELDLVSLNVNPVFDEEYDGQFHVVYVVPTGGSNPAAGSQTASVYWLKVDRSGRVVDVSQDSAGGNLDLDAEFEADGEAMYYSKVASTTASGSNPAGATTLSVADVSSFPGRGIITWTDSGTRRVRGYNSTLGGKFTLSSGTLLGDVPDGTAISLYSFKPIFSSEYSNAYQWLILAEIHVSSTSRVSDLSLIDTRQPGGVVKDSYRADAMAIDPRAIWARPQAFSTMGQIIPGDSAVVVRVPFTLLTEYGGQFTRDLIEETIASRHLATGMIPVILYYGAIPEISELIPLVGGVSVSWWSEGDGFSYNVYYSSTPTGPWTLANLTPVQDAVYANCYDVLGLLPGVKYYFKVTSISADGVESPSGVVWGARTRIS